MRSVEFPIRDAQWLPLPLCEPVFSTARSFQALQAIAGQSERVSLNSRQLGLTSLLLLSAASRQELTLMPHNTVK